MGGILNTNAAKGSVWCFIYPSPTLHIHRLLLASVEIAPRVVFLRPVLFIVGVLVVYVVILILIVEIVILSWPILGSVS